jgi:hypothetical protein
MILMAGLAVGPAPARTEKGEGREASRSARPRIPRADLEATRQGGRRPGVSPSQVSADRAMMPIPAGPGFPAITGDLGITPADPTGAAGATHVVTAVNVHYAIYLKDGTPVQGRTRLRDLFPRVPFPFDPKVVYDHYRDTFVLVYLGGRFFGSRRRSWINVVSMPESSIDTPSTWCKRKLKGDQVGGFGNLFADYPGLGFDGERVYITTNQFTFGSETFRYAQVLALRKRGLYDCDEPLRKKVFARNQTRDPEGTRAFTIQPAVTETDTGASPPEFLVSFQDTECGFACGRRLTIWRIRERPRRGLQLARTSVTVGLAFLAPLGTQKGGTVDCGAVRTCWDTGDLRLTSAFYDADRGFLYTAHAVQAQFGAGQVESAIRWYEIDPAPLDSTSVPRRPVFGELNTFAGWPAVATDATGNLFVTYSRATSSGPGEYLSVWVATIAPGTTAAEPDLIEPGNDTYVDPDNPGPQRWGDYNGISRDPVDPTVIWSVNQVAQDDGEPPGATTDEWQQWVHPLRMAP